MQALPISSRPTDLGQPFVAGGDPAGNAAGRQAGKGAGKSEGGTGSFFAALTLGEGDEETPGWAAQEHSPSLEGSPGNGSAGKGGAEEHDSQSDAPIVDVVTVVAGVEGPGEILGVAGVNDTTAAGWLWAGVETGVSELPAVVDEVGKVIEEGRHSSRAGRKDTDSKLRVDGTRSLTQKADGRFGVVVQKRPVQQVGAAVARRVGYVAADVANAVEAPDVAAVGLRVTSTGEIGTTGVPAPRVVEREVLAVRAPAHDVHSGKATAREGIAREVALARDAFGTPAGSSATVRVGRDRLAD